MSLSQSLGLELSNQDIGLQERFEVLLYKLKGRILSHTTGHLSSRCEDGVQFLSDLSRLLCQHMIHSLRMVLTKTADHRVSLSW
jgi:hypothetical protein